MNRPTPKVGDVLAVRPISNGASGFLAAVTKVGYRFFSVAHKDSPFAEIQFRLSNWKQRTSFNPDWTVSKP